MTLESTIYPDIAASGNAPELSEADEKLRRKIMADYRRLIRDEMGRIRRNALAYARKRAHPKSGLEPTLNKVLQGATFVAAHPGRFQPGGYNVEETQFFIVHRPGPKSKAARVDNIIRTFVLPPQDKKGKVSTHFIMSQTGALVQMVDLADIAYHCGTATPATNANSVGIELEGAIGDPISEIMFFQLARLIARVSLISGMPITVDTVLNHSTIAPRRKRDAWRVRRRNGAITDTRVQELVALANGELATLATSDPMAQYRAPFNPIEDRAAKTAEIMALAKSPGTSALVLMRIQAAAAQTASSTRSMFFAELNRSAIGEMAASHSNFLSETLGEGLAQFMRDNELRAIPVPQANVAGVLYDTESGLLNDGEPL